MACFSQAKEELIIGIMIDQDEFFIKVDLAPGRCMLCFPQEFKRARANSIDLFSDVIGLHIVHVKCHENERSFELQLEQKLTLVFKLFSGRSNVILFREEQPIILFKNKFENDWNLNLNQFNRALDQSFEAFERSEIPLKELFPTFGKVVKDYLEELGFKAMDKSQKWDLILEVIHQLNHPEYFIVNYGDRIHLSLVPIGEIKEKAINAIEAANSYHAYFFGPGLLKKEKEEIQRELEKKVNQGKNYIDKLDQKIQELNNRNYSKLADVIMANLHLEIIGQREVELLDFYTNRNTRIKLNPRLSLQKNAERYYQKSKNQYIEIDKLKESRTNKINQIKRIEESLANLAAIDSIRELRKRFSEEKKSTDKPNLPFNKYEIDGFSVLIGKNARLNDRLTLDYAHKDDLWFHAKDVAGSHVVLKKIPGKTFPKPTIEKVGQLAAWYSKGRNFPLCPVIHVPKKFVRKPKGFAPGMVKVEKEDVILVEPKNLVG